ncbi:hypothetical protein SAMN05216252_10996 [Actinacidiphila glaucinigra]|uniref:Uncharacterized protein n=1 Tax=Actinacidiphila glaucinigra TaxID=235986 RepID=A0A239HTQ3_9ACTN|nr:hypothetical protein SAMN05216252_10996 [Actinacidiphila glaucinigra]
MAARKPRTRHPHPYPPPHPPPGARTRPHDDAPDTAEALRRIAALPEGPEKEALREQVVIAWIPMSERSRGASCTAGSPPRTSGRSPRSAW